MTSSQESRWVVGRAGGAGVAAAFVIAAVRGVLAHPERLGLCTGEGFDCLLVGLVGLVITPFAALFVCWVFLRAFVVPCACLISLVGGCITFLVLGYAGGAGASLGPSIGAPVLAVSFAGMAALVRNRV